MTHAHTHTPVKGPMWNEGTQQTAFISHSAASYLLNDVLF